MSPFHNVKSDASMRTIQPGQPMLIPISMWAGCTVSLNAMLDYSEIFPGMAGTGWLEMGACFTNPVPGRKKIHR